MSSDLQSAATCNMWPIWLTCYMLQFSSLILLFTSSLFSAVIARQSDLKQRALTVHLVVQSSVFKASITSRLFFSAACLLMALLCAGFVIMHSARRILQQAWRRRRLQKVRAHNLQAVTQTQMALLISAWFVLPDLPKGKDSHRQKQLPGGSHQGQSPSPAPATLMQ